MWNKIKWLVWHMKSIHITLDWSNETTGVAKYRLLGIPVTTKYNKFSVEGDRVIFHEGLGKEIDLYIQY